MQTRLPSTIALPALLTCAVVFLSALGGVALAASGSRWYFLAFEVVVLVVGLTGALTALHRLPSGPALSLLCTGGIVAAAAALSNPQMIAAAMRGQLTAPDVLAGINIVPLLLARLAAGVALIGLSGLAVLTRQPARSTGLLTRGIVAGAPILAALAVIALPGPRGVLLGISPILLIPVAIISAFCLGILACISGHCFIRAFEVGVVPGGDSGRAPASAPQPQVAPAKG
ncbi:MAG: hypothetical protein SFZ24_00840 [Planctomycetota bacterium]|nr:hypothetical protein [Planctomycetota bacterium]